MSDLEVDRKMHPEAALADRWDPNADDEDDDDDDGDLDLDVVDPGENAQLPFTRQEGLILNFCLLDEGPYPREYIDITRAQRPGTSDQGGNWPRPR